MVELRFSNYLKMTDLPFNCIVLLSLNVNKKMKLKNVQGVIFLQNTDWFQMY